MSEIKALEKLRTMAKRIDDAAAWASEHGYSPIGISAIQIADEIEAEITERYMALPLDAGGVPIRIGDVVESFDCPKQDYARFTVEGYTSEFPDGKGKLLVVGGDDDGQWYSDTVRRFKPRKLEDVLTDFAQAIEERGTEWVDVSQTANAIRELLGVGE